MKTLRYGIEIETVGLNRERLARAIQTVTGGNVVNEGRGWRVSDATGRAWQVVPEGFAPRGADGRVQGRETGPPPSPKSPDSAHFAPTEAVNPRNVASFQAVEITSEFDFFRLLRRAEGSVYVPRRDTSAAERDRT